MDEKLNYRVVAKHANGNDVVLQEYDGIVMNDHAMFDIEQGATKEQMHEKFSLLQEERITKLREQQAQRVKEIGRHNPYINPFASALYEEEKEMMKHREETEAHVRADRVQNVVNENIEDFKKEEDAPYISRANMGLVEETVDGPVHVWPDPSLHDRGEILSLSAEEFQQHREEQEQRVQEIGRQEPYLDANNNYNLNSEVDDDSYVMDEEQMMKYRERLLQDDHPDKAQAAIDRVKMTEQMLETASEQLSAKSPHTLHFDDYIDVEKEATYNASDRVKMTEQMLETASELSETSPHTLYFDDYVKTDSGDRTLMSEKVKDRAHGYDLDSSTISQTTPYVDVGDESEEHPDKAQAANDRVKMTEQMLESNPQPSTISLNTLLFDDYVNVEDEVRVVEGKISVIPENERKALETIVKNEKIRNNEAIAKTDKESIEKDVGLDV